MCLEIEVNVTKEFLNAEFEDNHLIFKFRFHLFLILWIKSKGCECNEVVDMSLKCI